jgi:hypothetical protein
MMPIRVAATITNLPQQNLGALAGLRTNTQYEIAHGKSRDGVHYRPIRAGQQCRQSSQNQAADSGGQQFVEQRHEAGLALPSGKQRQRHHARQKNKYRRQFQNDREPAASSCLVNAAGAKHALNIHLVDAPLKYAAVDDERITPQNWIIWAIYGRAICTA